MSIRPNITLLFILSVLTVLLVIAIVFPEKGIAITEKARLKFVKPSELFSKENEEYADISHIIQSDAILDDTLLANLVSEEEIPWDTVRANADSLRRSIRRLEFPPNYQKLLYPVFSAMDHAASATDPVRIMHYGDSQIEGDRITSFIRNRLQRKFGGMGVGLVPVEHVYDFRFSVIQDNSDNWMRYTVYGNRDTTLLHDRYGALGSFARFSPYGQDTSSTELQYEAWVSFAPSDYSYPNTKHFQQCRIFYSHNPEPFMTELYQDEELTEAEMYPASSSLQTIRWIFDQPASNIRIVFRGSTSPEIYGIALDGLNGVAVDNIPMRGSAGLVFTKMDEAILRDHYNKLNTKLIILQFGGNVVPYITDYNYYERLFSSQLRRIKRVAPGAAVIVIGVADMSIKERNRYVSYPNIEKVRNALKNAALKNNAIYWDMYEAMGGKNSMPSWVFANPPLAAKDFVHFNPNGAKIIAHMFYNALMYEYNLYKKNTTQPDE
jgi:lysophospholipase L1-like esterase